MTRRNLLPFVDRVAYAVLLYHLIACVSVHAGEELLEVREPHIRLTGHTVRVSSLAFFRNGKTLVSGGYEPTRVRGQDASIGELKFWDVATGREKHQFKRDLNSVLSLSLSPDEKMLAIGSAGDFDARKEAFLGQVMLFDIDRMQPKILSDGSYLGEVFSVTFSPDGKTFASSSYNKEIHIWKVKTGRIISTMTGDGANLAFSPDGNTLASAHGRKIDLWNMKTGFVSSTQQAKVLGYGGHCVAFSPDGKTVATGYEKGVVLWSTATGKIVATLTQRIGYPQSAAISPNGKWLAVGSFVGAVEVFDLRTGTARAILRGHFGRGGERDVRCLAFSPDSKLLASGSYDKTIKLWKIEFNE